ncbi:MAG: hypothetical protein WCS89_04015 [Candidatus Paceibacterota bacterium]|jgi:hypothetical protein
METKFQTSFIPKQQSAPVVGGFGGGFSQRPKAHGASIFMAIAVITFLASAGGVAGAYFWKLYLKSANLSYKTELAVKEKQFDLNLIENLKQVNIQIDSARNLLSNHVAMSNIFDIIGQFTIEKVRFLSMDFKAPANSGGNFSVSMKGYGTSLESVAFQSDILGQLSEYNLSKIVKNPILFDPTLDSNGTVSFGFSAEIDPGSLSYKRTIESGLNNVSGTSTDPLTTP